MRRRLAWALAGPLLALGELAGHQLAYLVAVPHAGARAELMHRTGHDWLAVGPELAAALGIAALLALSLPFRHASAPAPSYRLALLPPLAFLLQEHLERLAHDGVFPWHATLGRPVLVGLVLQVPLALLAVALARLVHGFARSLARARGVPRLVTRPAPLPRPRRLELRLARRYAAGSVAVRGPPFLA